MQATDRQWVDLVDRSDVQSTLWEAVAVVHEHVRLGMAKESYVAQVLQSVPARLGLVDMEVAAGSPDVHSSSRTLAVDVPGTEVPAVVVLHFDGPITHPHEWTCFARTIAALIGLLHIRLAATPPLRPGRDEPVGAPPDTFDDWLLERNATLERELERVKALARFLVETAQRQLGD